MTQPARRFCYLTGLALELGLIFGLAEPWTPSHYTRFAPELFLAMWAGGALLLAVAIGARGSPWDEV